MKRFQRILLSSMIVGLGALAATAAMAQVSDADVTLRPGDTIVWSPGGAHGVRFGGTVSVGGVPVVLTEWAAVQSLLEFTPTSPAPDLSSTPGQARFPAAAQVSAVVAADAADAIAPSFVFTCIVAGHANPMTSLTLKVVPADASVPPRTLEIITQGIAWHLRTPTGTVAISPRPPVPGGN